MIDSLKTTVKLDGSNQMTGNLKMGSSQIKGVAIPADPQDTATKNYVDGRKPLLMVWAEENSTINNDLYEWSFGNGANGATHASCDYTMTWEIGLFVWV